MKKEVLKSIFERVIPTYLYAEVIYFFFRNSVLSMMALIKYRTNIAYLPVYFLLVCLSLSCWLLVQSGLRPLHQRVVVNNQDLTKLRAAISWDFLWLFS